MSKQKGGDRKPPKREASSERTRKKPYASADLRKTSEDLRALAGRFEGLAARMESEGIDTIEVDGAAMLTNSLNNLDLFLIKGDAARHHAKVSRAS